jgi:methionyl-tRNA formyltransferase
VTDGPAPGSRVRTVFLGSGGFGIPALRSLIDHPDIELVGFVTAPARPVGRRQAVTPTPVEVAAREAAIGAILTPTRLRSPEAIDAVLDLRPGLAVLADYGQIVPAALLGLPHAALNLHPSLLPRFRGATPIPAAILAGDGETGVTLMQMDDGLDTGPIVAQVHASLDAAVTAPGLETRLAGLAATLLEANLGAWLRGALPVRPQSDEEATLTRPLRREDGRLDPREPSLRLARQVRAYQPWPGSFVDTIGGRMVVWDAEASGLSIDGEDRTPGRIGRYGMYAADGGYLTLREVQPAGGDRMHWQDFIRGRPAVVGSMVVTPR